MIKLEELKCVDYDINLEEYGENKESEFETLLDYKGRARGLTQERLDEINELSKRKYVIRPLFMEIVQVP